MPPRPATNEDPSPSPLHRNNSTEVRAMGFKAGAIFLASNGAKRAQEEAEKLSEGFSINGALRGELARGAESRGTSESGPKRPTPPSLRKMPGAVDGAEGSIRELTKQANVEDDLIRKDEHGTPARTRQDSISRGTAAGLGTPFGRKEKVEVAKQYPPTSSVRPVRKRTTSDASTGSTGSTSKDYLLSQLAEALKKERRRCQLYEQEILAAEEEIDEIAANLEAMNERYEQTFRQQDDTIKSLRAQLSEVRHEVSTAHDLDALEARAYLALISRPHSSSNPSPSYPPTSRPLAKGHRSEDNLIARVPLVSAFSGTMTESRTHRRVEGRLAASSDTDLPLLPKVPFYRRTRKLSKVKRDVPVAEIEKPYAITSSPPIETQKEKSYPPVAGGGGRPRKGSLGSGIAKTLRVIFPTHNSRAQEDADLPTSDAIQEWLSKNERVPAGPHVSVGSGYANPFVKAG